MSFKGRNIMISAVMVALFVALFMVFQAFGIQSLFMTDGNGNMPNCHGSSNGLCNMNIVQHVSQWQSLTDSMASHQSVLIIFFLAVVSLFVLKLVQESKEKFLGYLEISPYHPRNYFVEIFSRGIIHPKTF